MPQILLYAASIVVFLHGLIHLMGVAVYWKIAKIKGLDYKTRLLGGRWDVGYWSGMGARPAQVGQANERGS
ncbi:MAG TPA: hypothetical protein G4O11_06655 [Anaerolineae bacterium]|nr:hypothetical protein [Anaerolineae bacterium]